MTKIDLWLVDNLLTEPEQEAFDKNLLARVESILKWCRRWARFYEREFEELGAKTWSGSGVPGDCERQMVSLGFSEGFKRERHHIAALLGAISAPSESQDGLGLRWDVDAMESIIAERRTMIRDGEAFDGDLPDPLTDEERPAASNLKPEKIPEPAPGGAPGLHQAVKKAMRELGRPGHGGPRFTIFADRVREDCGVKPTEAGYSDRTIRRVVASLASPHKDQGNSET